MTQTPTIRKVPQLNIEHIAGDSFTLPFTVESSANVPQDLTGRTYSMVIVVPGWSNITIDGNTGTPSEGIVTFDKDKTWMATLTSGNQYDYEVKYTMTGNIEQTSLIGKIIVV